MLKRTAQMALAIFVLGVLAAGSAHAQAKCQGSKMKAAGKKASCLLSLRSKQVGKNKPIDPAKVQACGDKMTASFTKAETKPPCATTGDAAAIEAKVDRFVDEIAEPLALTPPSKCQSAKLKAAGKKAKCLLGAEAKALSKSIAPDFTKCVEKFNSAWAKAEVNTDCGAAVNDAPKIEALVDALDDDVACELAAGPACDCGSADPAFLNFTTSLGSGNCGDVENSSGAPIAVLGCNNLYTGGGAAAVPPSIVPDYGTTITRTSCCRNKFFALSAATSVDTGSNRNCSAAGCLYGPPLPIVSGASVCVTNVIASDAAGFGYCDAGSMSIDLPLTSQVRLSLDSLPKRCDGSSGGTFPGRKCAVDADCNGGLCVDDSVDIQPCPICNPSTLVCNGGTNNGLACTPGSLLVTGPQFPTSHDCPLAQAPIGFLPIPYLLTTGTPSKTSVDLPSQVRVFCGFCGDPANAIFKNPPVACSSDADCATITTGCGAMGTDPCSACKQHTPGAFGTQAARTITEGGSPAGPIATGGSPAAATLASVFCIPPTFNGTIDGVGDLPGPGAVSIQGTAQLVP
jgi:hypothetical protein